MQKTIEMHLSFGLFISHHWITINKTAMKTITGSNNGLIEKQYDFTDSGFWNEISWRKLKANFVETQLNNKSHRAATSCYIPKKCIVIVDETKFESYKICYLE